MSQHSPSKVACEPNAHLRMPLVPALEVLRHERRDDEVVVTSMGSAREWPRLSRHELDFHYVPSAMGQAQSLALGIALAQPGRHVIAITGDGSLLMNLGSLVTVSASGATNLTIVVLENGIYEVTGGQQTAAASGGLAPRRVDFAVLSLAAGIPSARRFHDLSQWQEGARLALRLPGPRVIVLSVSPVDDYELPMPTPAMLERVAKLRAALANA
ncbi:MAG: thiamine pyrophosphate-dependent enzyme [Pirellulales bacterium]